MKACICQVLVSYVAEITPLYLTLLLPPFTLNLRSLHFDSREESTKLAALNQLQFVMKFQLDN